MLSTPRHKPVFDVLFKDYDFTSSNPISIVMQDMSISSTRTRSKRNRELQGFYDSVKLRVEGIDNAAGKQKIVTELYEGFFSKAFPKAAESLGIVYTPIELVDFILHATDHALRKHFNGLCISDEGIDVLDPFCGTGTFIVRLLQSASSNQKTSHANTKMNYTATKYFYSPTTSLQSTLNALTTKQ